MSKRFNHDSRARLRELRQSEYLRRLAQEITRVGAFEWNIVTGVNTWTPELEALYGLRPGGFAGTQPAWEQLVHPEDRARAVAAVQRAFDTSETVAEEWRVIWPDGSIHWLAGRFRILRDEAGQPRTLTGVNIDITEHKRAEEALSKSEERYRFLFENMLNGYAYCRMLYENGIPQDFIYLDVNNSFERLTGLKDVVGKRVSEVIPDIRRSNPQLFEIYGRVASTGQPEKFEIYVERLKSWFSVSVHSPHREHFVALFENITERKQAEAELVRHREHLEELVQERAGQLRAANAQLQAQAEELRAANGELRDSEQARTTAEERLNLAMESGKVGVWEWEGDAEGEEWSQGVYALLGYQPGEVAATRSELRQRVHPQDLARYDQALKDALERCEDYSCQFRVVWTDGSVHWVESRGQCAYLPRENGIILRLRGVLADIDARKQAGEALRESEERFRALTMASSEVLYRMSPDWSEMRQLHSRTFLANTERPSRTWLAKYIHPDDQPHVTAVIEEAIRTKSIFELEHRVQRADGTLGWTFSRAVPLLDTNGEILEWFGAASDITERKKAEEALHESEEKFRVMAETSHAAISLYQDGQVVYANRAAEDIFGYSLDERRRMSLLAFVHPDFQTLARERMKVLLEGGSAGSENEYKIIRKDGQERWVLSSSSRLTFGGKPAVLVSSLDITKRKKAEEAVRQSERQFRSTFENAAIGIAHVDLDGHILQFNNRFCEIAGYLPDDIIGKTCEEITFADDWEAERVQMQQLLDEQVDHYAIEKRYIRTDGSPVWVNLTRSIQRDEAGRPEYFIVIVEDISDRKRAQEALGERMKELTCLYATSRDLQEELSVEELCRRVIAHLVPAMQFPESAVAVIELNGKRFASENYTEGLSHGFQAQIGVEGEVLGHLRVYYAPERAFLIPEEQNMVDAVAEALSTWLVRKHAEAALRELNAALENKVAERTAELKHRAKQLQKLTLDMSETEDRERKRMAEILHDDLQQQLAGAKFHLGLMRHRARYDASVQAIGAQVDHMLKDAIDKSRSLSHELSPTVLHHADFVQTLRWLADDVQAKHGLLVRVRAPGAVPLPSDALKGFLYRAAQELLFNVVKHAGVNEAEIRVRQCCGHVCLAVSDRGRGFDPQGLGEASGFGLLSIRERIALLGGRMKIKSAKGTGSTFLIIVPNGPIVATSAKTAARPNGRAKAAEQAAEEKNGRLRVLLADDHEIVREGLRSLLSDAHDVEVVGEAANGREAVDLASQLQPDVIIMDMSMPLIEGAEATRQIKAYLPRTRVIALSMYDQSEKVEAMYRAGAENYVLKTAPTEELLAAIRGSRVHISN